MRLSICIFLALAVPADGQQKLVDVVRSASHDVEFTTRRQFSPAELADLVGGADLVVRVVAIAARSRLASDEAAIETDYSVQILESYAASHEIPSQTIVVSKPGGEIVVDGRMVRSTEPDFPPFQIGEEYVLFLSFDSTRASYVIPHGAQGAFRHVGGGAEQMSRFNGKIVNERGLLPLAGFAQEIRELAAGRPAIP